MEYVMFGSFNTRNRRRHWQNRSFRLLRCWLRHRLRAGNPEQPGHSQPNNPPRDTTPPHYCSVIVNSVVPNRSPLTSSVAE